MGFEHLGTIAAFLAPPRHLWSSEVQGRAASLRRSRVPKWDGLKIGYLRTPRVNHHISSSFMINRPADSIALSSLSLFQNEMNIAIWGISSHRHIQLLPAPPSTPGYWLLVSGLASAHPKDIDRPRSSITVSVPADGGFLVSVM